MASKMTVSVGFALLLAVPAMARAETETVATKTSTSYGTYLSDDGGHAVYMFTADGKSKSGCIAACAKAWPPMMTSGAPLADAGVKKGLLGTIPRDGGMQVTYGGMPLYYFVGDIKAGTTAGEGIEHFGGKWYLVAPDGNKIDDDDMPNKSGSK